MSNKGNRAGGKSLITNTLFISLIHILAAFTAIYHLSLSLMILIGFYNVTFLNMANSILQMNTTDVYRGRVMSIYSLVNMGSTPLGNFFAGTIMEFFGPAMGFFYCGAAALALTGILLLFNRRRGHTYNG
jgi:predicted MFS family arabinose efflux permease